MGVLRNIVVSAPAALASLCFVGPAAGQEGPAASQDGGEFPHLVALSADAYVRAGADVRYYAFGRLETGDVVKAIGEKAGFAQIVTAGPAFEEFFGYVRQPRRDSASLEIADGGRRLETLLPTDVFAPNLDASYDPGSSWKPAATVPAGRTLKIIETVENDREIVHRVALPADAKGWIDLRYLRAATDAEEAAWIAAQQRVAEADAGAQKTAAPDSAEAPVETAAAEVEGPPVESAPSGEAAASSAEPSAGDESDVVAVKQESLGRAKLNAAASIEEPAAPGPRRPQEGAPAPRRSNVAQVALQDLEEAYKRLLAQPVETAEVGALRSLYLDLAARHRDSRALSRYAETRAQQLGLWREVQRRRGELVALRARAGETAEAAREAQQTLAGTEDYVAVGRLETSIIYDGRRLPKLLRLRDPVTGRTLGYLEPDGRFDLAGLLGRRIGIVGSRAEDAGLPVVLLKPKRVDPLDDGAVADTE